MKYQIIVSVLFLVSFRSNTMELNPDQELLNAITANDEAAAQKALNHGASPKGKKFAWNNSLSDSHEPLFETMKRDNLAIFKLLIPYYDSIGGWEYNARVEKATTILSYISHQKLIQGGNKKNENQHRPTDCSN